MRQKQYQGLIHAFWPFSIVSGVPKKKFIEKIERSSKVAVFSFIPRICSMLEVILICQMLKSSLDNES